MIRHQSNYLLATLVWLFWRALVVPDRSLFVLGQRSLQTFVYLWNLCPNPSQQALKGGKGEYTSSENLLLCSRSSWVLVCSCWYRMESVGMICLFCTCALWVGRGPRAESTKRLSSFIWIFVNYGSSVWVNWYCYRVVPVMGIKWSISW